MHLSTELKFYVCGLMYVHTLPDLPTAIQSENETTQKWNA